MYRYGLVMVEVDEKMGKADDGWVHRPLTALLKTRENLLNMSWKNV